jgi:hypothetical protein
MQQTVWRQGVQKLTVGFHSLFTRPIAKPHLPHGKGTEGPGNLVPIGSPAIVQKGVDDGILKWTG